MLKLFSLDLDHPPPQTLPETTSPPNNHASAQYFQQKPTYLHTVNV